MNRKTREANIFPKFLLSPCYFSEHFFLLDDFLQLVQLLFPVTRFGFTLLINNEIYASGIFDTQKNQFQSRVGL